jgi:hypothetical protein
MTRRLVDAGPRVAWILVALGLAGCVGVAPRAELSQAAALNTEQGVFVESETIADELDAIFAAQSGAARAWAVSLDGNEVVWSDGA